MGIPRIMLRDMSDLDGICPSYITGDMSMGPILNQTRMTYYACVQYRHEDKRVIMHKIFITERLVRSHDILITWVTVMCCQIPLTVYNININIIANVIRTYRVTHIRTVKTGKISKTYCGGAISEKRILGLRSPNSCELKLT